MRPVLFVGEGITGELEMIPRTLDFGQVVVGTEYTKEFVVFNKSFCSLKFNLDIGAASDIFDIEPKSAIIPSRTRMTFCATAKARSSVKNSFSVPYSLDIFSNSNVPGIRLPPETHTLGHFCFQ